MKYFNYFLENNISVENLDNIANKIEQNIDNFYIEEKLNDNEYQTWIKELDDDKQRYIVYMEQKKEERVRKAREKAEKTRADTKKLEQEFFDEFEAERKVEQSKQWEAEDHQIKIDRITEDAKDNGVGQILRALGIHMPSGILSQAKTYKRANEDIQRIKDRAGDRDLNEQEQNKVNNLEEIAAKAKPANDLLEKFGLDVEKTFSIIKKGAPIVSIATFVISGLVTAIKLISRFGRELTETYNKNVRAMSIYGETLDKQKDNLSKLYGITDANSQKIKEGWNNIFKNTSKSLATTEIEIQKLILGFQDFWSKESPIKEIIKNVVLNLLPMGPRGIVRETFRAQKLIGNEESEDQVEQTDNSKSLEYIERLYKANPDLVEKMSKSVFIQMVGNQLNNITDNNEELSASEYIIERLYKAAQGSFMWKNYSNNAEMQQEFLDNILGATESGNTLSAYGIDTSDDVLAGYLYSIGANPMLDYYSDSQKDVLRARLEIEQLNAKDSNSLLERNRLWKEQGQLINDCKDALMSFDEVNILGAKNTNILDLEETQDILDGDIDNIVDALNKGIDIAELHANRAIDNVGSHLRQIYSNLHNDLKGHIDGLYSLGPFNVKNETDNPTKNSIPSFGVIDLNKKVSTISKLEDETIPNYNKTSFSGLHNTKSLSEGINNPIYNQKSTINVNVGTIISDDDSWNELAERVFDIHETRALRGG